MLGSGGNADRSVRHRPVAFRAQRPRVPCPGVFAFSCVPPIIAAAFGPSPTARSPPCRPANGCRVRVPRSDHGNDYHRRQRRPVVDRVVRVARGHQSDRVQRANVPPMVESVLDVRRPGEVLQAAVRSGEKVVFVVVGRVPRPRNSYRHGVAAHVHRVVHAAPARHVAP